MVGRTGETNQRSRKGADIVSREGHGKHLHLPWVRLLDMDQRRNTAARWWLLLFALTGVLVAPLAAAVQQTAEARADRLLKVVASITGETAAPEPVKVRVRPLRSAFPPAGPRLGWFDPDARELNVLGGVDASIDEALFSMVQAELRQALGVPASSWFERGIIHGLLGSCDGFGLNEIESRTEAVTPRSVLGPSWRRARISMAPAETRLARSLLVATEQGVRAAWQIPVTVESDLLSELEDAWDKSFERSPIEPRLGYPRSVEEGVYVSMELASLPHLEFQKELERIQRLGFAGIRLGVSVPVDASSRASDPVTMEGDSALLVAARLAASMGLSVVLAPRFLEAPSDDPVIRARAVEGLSWLAEQGRVDGVVLFEPGELRLPESRELDAAERASRRDFRRRVLTCTRPFVGDRLAFAETEEALSSAQSEDFRKELRGALAVVRLKVGLGSELESPRLRFAGSWGPDPADPSSDGLRDLSDERLQEIAGSAR